MACRMLAETRESVTDIGHACGLGSSSYFERRSENTQDMRLWSTTANGRIMVVSPDGKRTDINGRTGIQRKLQAEYLENGKCLSITLFVT